MTQTTKRLHALSRRAFLGASAGLAACGVKKQRRPNIIVIVTDDQRPDAMSCFDGPATLDFMKTPNMDRLAAGGARFRNAFVTTSLCAPSRATMMTGTRITVHGVDDNRLKELRPEIPLFPGMLKEAGYETGFVGKWHIGANSDTPRPEFDHWAGVRGQGTYFNPVLNINGSRTEFPGYSEEVFAGHALEFIRKKRDNPFFLWLGHKAPHAPCTPPKHLETLYDDIKLRLPETYTENHDDKPDWFVNCHDHDAFRKLLYPESEYEKYVKNYARSLNSVDEQLGRIMDELDVSGIAEDTAILYLGDNGHFLGEHQLYSKMLPYEESLRVAMLARYPAKIPAGSVTDGMVLNMDVPATVLDWAGVTAPGHMQGRSFRQLAEGDAPADWRKSYRYEYINNYWGVPTLEAVRTADNWLYARYYNWEQLYDMNEDPRQVRNLAEAPEYAARKRELAAELERLGGGKLELKPEGLYKGRQLPPVRPPAA